MTASERNPAAMRKQRRLSSRHSQCVDDWCTTGVNCSTKGLGHRINLCHNQRTRRSHIARLAWYQKLTSSSTTQRYSVRRRSPQAIDCQDSIYSLGYIFVANSMSLASANLTMLSHVFDSFSAHGKIGNFIIFIKLQRCRTVWNNAKWWPLSRSIDHSRSPIFVPIESLYASSVGESYWFTSYLAQFPSYRGVLVFSLLTGVSPLSSLVRGEPVNSGPRNFAAKLLYRAVDNILR